MHDVHVVADVQVAHPIGQGRHWFSLVYVPRLQEHYPFVNVAPATQSVQVVVLQVEQRAIWHGGHAPLAAKCDYLHLHSPLI